MKILLFWLLTSILGAESQSDSLSYVRNSWTQLTGKMIGTERLRPRTDSVGLSVATTAGTTFAFFDSANQRVGIGTQAPLGKLHIEEDTDDHLKLTYPGVSTYNFFVNALGDMDIKEGLVSRIFLQTDGKIGVGTSSPKAKLDIGNGVSTYTTGTPVIAVGENDTAYYPEIQTVNRTYVHFKGSGGASAFNVGILGHQAGNPAATNWVRVGPNVSSGTVVFFTVEDDGIALYGDGGKSTGDADYIPTKRFEVTAAGAVNVAGDSITIQSSQTPASTDPCTTGEIAWGANYIYVCTASGAWKRAALTGGY